MNIAATHHPKTNGHALSLVAKMGAKLLMAFLAGVFITGALAGSWALYVNLSDNIHTVQEGVMYRSAQLSAHSLENAIRDHGIETVINLRGAHPDDKWYQDELKVTDKLSVQHIDFKLSASKVPNQKTMAQLNDILENAPKPILVHCQGGADRSGLVSAFYQHVFAGKSAEESEEQLSFYYGHFPWFWSHSAAMDIAFERYAEEPQDFIVGKQ